MVHKFYEDPHVVAKLKIFYSETATVIGLEHCAEDALTMHPCQGGASYEVFNLVPVGIPASDWEFDAVGEIQQLLDDLTKTLTSLHRLGWVHIDIRTSNVVLHDPRGDNRRWHLIDSEYAVRLGEAVPKKRYTEAYAGCPATPKHDFDQLSKMVRKLTQGFDDAVLNAALDNLSLDGEEQKSMQVASLFMFSFLWLRRYSSSSARPTQTGVN